MAVRIGPNLTNPGGAKNGARHRLEEMMSNQQVGICADRLQYLFEVLHVIRKIKRDRFPDIEAELTALLGLLASSCESLPFHEVMSICDKCADAIESKMRESRIISDRRRGVTRSSEGSEISSLSTAAGFLHS